MGYVTSKRNVSFKICDRKQDNPPVVFMQMFLSLVNDIQSIKIIHVNSLIKYREFMKDCKILVAQCTLLKGVLQTFDSFTKFAGNLHTFHIIYQVLISAVLNNHTNPVINNIYIETKLFCFFFHSR